MNAVNKLDRSQLWSLEEYASEREAFRATVIEHKKARRVALGPHATLIFEDFLTMKYQVQEMLRVERIYDPAEIADEIDTYNPLIPDGSNWKATFMIEYADVNERQAALTRMPGIEHKVWVQVDGFGPVFAVANEDLERTNATKTAAVHFLRFELDLEMAAAVKAGAEIAMGIDHPELPYRVEVVGPASRDSLAGDLS
jgi:hypothetical protein